MRRGTPARVQRYLCHHCGRSFSSRTFAVGYWLRGPERLAPVFFRINACSGLRQIARELGVSASTVQRLVERLGRHCLLLHERWRPHGAPGEPLVLDGFRSFERGRYWPFDLNLLIGASHFVYGFSDAELRRSGRMTGGQAARRALLEARHGRPDPGATARSVAELVGRVVPPGAAARVHSDRHPAYGPALAALSDRHIEHRTTSARDARTARNPLFPANLADLLLRHNGANHKRRTIAFSKRRQGALYRAAIWMVWRNYVQWGSEVRRSPPPGVAIGAMPRRVGVREVLATRLFPWREQIRGWLSTCYFARVPTRSLPRARPHRLRYAI